MGNLKLCSEDDNELGILLHTVQSFKADIEIECCLDKCAKLIFENGKLETSH